jgi:hypothetical protein
MGKQYGRVPNSRHPPRGVQTLRSVHLLNLEKIQRRLAWPLRKDDTQYLLKSESFFYYYYYSTSTSTPTYTSTYSYSSRCVERDGRRRSRDAARSRGVARANASVFRGYHLVLLLCIPFGRTPSKKKKKKPTSTTVQVLLMYYCNNNDSSCFCIAPPTTSSS